MNAYEQKALLYAEKYGIITYEVKGTKMTYKEAFWGEGTYKAVVNLDTMEETRKRVNKKF